MSENIYRDAIRAFGAPHQIQKAIEEMSELTKELCKDLDKKGNLNHIAEELADVEITLAQLKLIYSNAALVDIWKQRKLVELRNRIEEENYG